VLDNRNRFEVGDPAMGSRTTTMLMINGGPFQTKATKCAKRVIISGLLLRCSITHEPWAAFERALRRVTGFVEAGATSDLVWRFD
jgi:hypothetical protein